MSDRIRIAVGGIASENSTFNSLPTVLEDFHVLRGRELIESNRYPFMDRIQRVELVPTLVAGALPGGVVRAGAYAELKEELLSRLRVAVPVDGLYLDLHGALSVEGILDPEGDLIEAARSIVGDDALVGASFDLHGTVTDWMADNLGILTAYRTAPHLDAVETREKALTLLTRCLREGLRPVTSRVGIPVALPGDITSTRYEPMAGVYRMLEEIDLEPGVLYSSLLIGYCWADNPHSMATAVVSGLDGRECRRWASSIASAYWEHRREYHYGVKAGSMDQCVRWALAEPSKPVFITDSGDNPTGGGVGDLTYALERLTSARVEDAVVAAIPDVEAMRQIKQAGTGAEVALSLGGKLDTVNGTPLRATGTVQRIESVGPGYEFATAHGMQAVVQIGGVKVVVTERRTPFHYPSQFRRLGIQPTEHKIVVVKLGYLQPDLQEIAAGSYIALTPGAICQDLSSLPYTAIGRPIFPLDAGMEWAPPHVI